MIFKDNMICEKEGVWIKSFICFLNINTFVKKESKGWYIWSTWFYQFVSLKTIGEKCL